MNALWLFGSTFLLVFALGLQSLNVNGGHYRMAFFTSFVIGAMQMVLLKLGPDAGALEIAAYLGGGPLGIIASMKAHEHRVARLKNGGKVPAPRPWPAPPTDTQ